VPTGEGEEEARRIKLKPIKFSGLRRPNKARRIKGGSREMGTGQDAEGERRRARVGEEEADIR
jgi:hypothetical protein